MKSILNDADRGSLVERIGRVRPDTPRRWGRMTPHGMVCHLTDSFLGVLGDRPIGDVSTWAGRTVMKWFALSVPLPWPKSVPTAREVDQERDGTPPGDFTTDVSRLVDLTDDGYRRSALGDELGEQLKALTIWSERWSDALMEDDDGAAK